jgi:uncharacterized protein (TIGR03086 family)
VTDTSMLGRMVVELNRVVDNIKPEQLGDPTPCTEWTVRDVLNHVAAGGTMFAVGAEQGSVPDDVLAELFTQDQLGDDYKAAVRATSERAVAAFSAPGVLERVLSLPIGQMPGQVAADIAVFDVTTHICDLAKATGQQVTDDGLLERALANGQAIDSPEIRQPGRLGPQVPTPAGASPSDALLAFAGRKI